jgi:hypothetical protein
VSARVVRTELRDRVTALGYQPLATCGHDDVFLEPMTGHRAAVVPFPRWGRRMDIISVESSFPLPLGGQAIAFRLDVGSQVHPEGASVPGRWNPQQVRTLCDDVVIPYLERVRQPRDILDMLLTGEIRPPGSAAAAAVLQHGYFLAKWWALTDRVPALREVAEVLPAAERVQLQHAPWGRTELAEVLWFDRELPPPPERLPWGPGDQGDQRAERWFRNAGQFHPDVDAEGVARHQVQSPRTV